MDIEALNDIPYLGRLTEALYDKKINLREIGVTIGTGYGTVSFLKWGVPKVIDKSGAVEATKKLVSKIGQVAINKGWVDPKVEVTETVTRNKLVDGKVQYETYDKDVKYKSGPKKGQVQFKKDTRIRYQSGPKKGSLKPITEKVQVTKLSTKGQTNFKVGQKYLKGLGKKMWKNPIIGKTRTGKLFRFGTIALILYPQKGEAAEDLTIGEVYQEGLRQEFKELGIDVYDPLEDTEREI